MKNEVLSVLKFPIIKFKVNDVKITSNKIDKEYNVPDPSLPLIGEVQETILITFSLKAY